MYVSYFDFLKVFSILVQHVNILCLYGKKAEFVWCFSSSKCQALYTIRPHTHNIRFANSIRTISRCRTLKIN